VLLFVGPGRQVNPNGEDAARPCLDVDRHCKLNVLFVDCVHARLSDQVPQILDRLEVSINWEAPRTLVVLITAQIMQLLAHFFSPDLTGVWTFGSDRDIRVLATLS